jgi:Arylsulfatase regulator (Fe-S oxidoreductase)
MEDKMIQAKNNIIVKIQNTNEPEYAIMNPITGSFDLMGDHEYQLFLKFTKGEALPDDFSAYLLERGYAYDNYEAQNIAINKAYEDFNNEVARSQIQLMLVPTYGCNLACTYCYQGRGTGLSSQGVPINIGNKPTLISKETVDAFFYYAEMNFSKSPQKPFITLFGGEPLVNSPVQKSIIQYICDKCAGAGYELSAVTNGYDFVEYIDILKKVKIKEIQFTLDGSKDIHDNRRATANKKGTFDRIIAGIEAAVENKMPVNLRSVVDTENIEDMISLAEYLDKKGWLDLLFGSI